MTLSKTDNPPPEVVSNLS